jgi:hypothetical protein
LYFVFLTVKKINKTAFFNQIALFVFSGLILLSFSKTAIIYWMIGSLFWFKKKIDCRICFLAKFLAVCLSGFVFISAGNDLYTLTNRLLLLKESLFIFEKRGFVGVGLGAYVKAKELISSLNLKYYLITQPVHNLFFLIFIEGGVIFSLGFIFLLFKSIKKIYQKNPTIFLLILITGFFDHYWWTLPQNFFLLAFIAAIVLD